MLQGYKPCNLRLQWDLIFSQGFNTDYNGDDLQPSIQGKVRLHCCIRLQGQLSGSTSLQSFNELQ
eukprot:1144614-Pelagomonas_calceolata.AAC.1